MELELEYSLTLSLQGYADLVRCLNHYVRRLKPNERNNGSNTSIIAEFGMLKKPGKKIRAALVKKKRKKFELATQKVTEKFLEVSSLGRYVFGSEISYNKPPPRLPGLGC